MAATKCYRCGLPYFASVMGVAPSCQCFIAYRSAPNAAAPLPTDGCHPARQLTEADVRRIVREELAKDATHPTRRDERQG